MTMNNKNLKPYMFNQKAHFGTYKTVTNENNGQNTTNFVDLFSLWCAPITRTLNQRFQLQGTDLSDTITIAVRHNTRVKKDNSIIVRYRDDDYRIVDLSVDDSNNINTFDYLTLEAKKS